MKNSSYSPCIEALESRLAPAGLVAVSVNSAGTLVLATVAGLDGNEEVSVDRLNDGSYRISAVNPGTTLRIGGTDYTTPQIVTGVTGGLIANLGAGDDILAIGGAYFTKAVTVNLGDGDNVFQLTNGALGGALTVTTGAGADLIILASPVCTVAGAATFKLGAGDDIFNGIAVLASFGAGLKIDGGAGYDQIQLAASDGNDFRVMGNLTVTGGDGNDTIRIGQSNTTVDVSGTLLVSDGAGNEFVVLSGNRIDAGSLQFQLGSGNNTLYSTVTDITLARNFQWRTTTGNDEMRLDGTTLRIGTNLEVAMGAGNSIANVRPDDLLQVGGTVNIGATAPAAAAAEVERTFEILSAEIRVGGKATLSGGAGEGEVKIIGSQVYLGRGAALTSGAGVTELQVGSGGVLVSNGALSLTHGGGDGSLLIYGATGSVVNGALSMKGGDALFLQMGGIVTGAVNLATSAAAVDSPAFTLLSFDVPLHLAGTVNLSMPTRTGQSGLMTLTGVVVEGAAKFLGGAGADTLRINDCDFEKTVTASVGAGNDRIELERENEGVGSFYHGAVLLQGGAGIDVFLLGGNTATTTAVTFSNKVTVDGGADTDFLDIGSQATFNPAFPLKQIGIS
jgi:hypothetical protein